MYERRCQQRQRRHEHGRHPDTEPGEIEPELADTIVWRDGTRSRRDVVVAAAVLVVGDDQQGLVPCWPVAQRVIHIVDELLTEGYLVVGVLAVA